MTGVSGVMPVSKLTQGLEGSAEDFVLYLHHLPSVFGKDRCQIVAASAASVLARETKQFVALYPIETGEVFRLAAAHGVPVPN